MTIAPTSRVATIDSIGTAAECGDDSRKALMRAKLDFNVALVPVKNPRTNQIIRGADGEPSYFATVREDTNEVLGIVEGRYRVIPNNEAFQIADTMIEEDGAIITRASALDGGGRCFLNLEWPRQKNVNVRGDIVGRRAIIQNSHNGKHSTIIRLQPLRLACLNGMVLPVPAFSFEFRIKHTESADDRIKEARNIMSGASRYFSTFGRIADLMAKTEIPNSLAKELIGSIPDLKKDTTANEKKRDEIFALFDGGQAGSNSEGVRGTAWGLLNAVTEFADHNGRIRLTKGSSEAAQRFKSSFEGSAQRLKLTTWETLCGSSKLGLSQMIKEMVKNN